MKRLTLLTTVVLAALTNFLPNARAGSTDAGYVHQIGTYDYLITPDYDALAPIVPVIGGATIGLGTFDRLDGELVMLGGKVYRVPTSGKPIVVGSGAMTPFVQVVDFVPQRSAIVERGTTCAELSSVVTEIAGVSDGIIAVRLHGTFRDLTTRSIPSQLKPFQPLADVVAKQTVFDLGGTKATLVGFWQGPSMAGAGAPGLHLHGLTASRDAGGHVLSCTLGKVRIAVQATQGVIIHDIR